MRFARHSLRFITDPVIASNVDLLHSMHLCIFLCMSKDDLNAELSGIRHLVITHGLSQSLISRETGISQSQVSRILSGSSKRRSTAVDAVCTFVRSSVPGVAPGDVRKCTPLINAISAVWDGSQAHADALGSVIRSLGALAPPNSSRRRPPASQ